MDKYQKGKKVKFSFGEFIVENTIEKVPTGFRLAWEKSNEKCPHCDGSLAKQEICFPSKIIILNNNKNEKAFLAFVPIDDEKGRYKILRLPDKTWMPEQDSTNVVEGLLALEV